MEKFQMLFPASSSSSSSTQYYDHRHHHDHHNNLNFLSSSSPPSMDRGRDGPLMMTMRTSAADHHDHEHQEEEEEEEEEEQGVTVEAGAADRGEKEKEKKKKKVKQARFAFQTRSQVDILDDGYRWRKYGQKAVKNNKFPRSYYRCTYQGCNVKKQVQRLTRDEGVVVTTYEGVHTHPIEKPTDNFEHILSRMQIYSTPV